MTLKLYYIILYLNIWLVPGALIADKSNILMVTVQWDPNSRHLKSWPFENCQNGGHFEQIVWFSNGQFSNGWS